MEDGVLCAVVATTTGIPLPDVDVVGKCNDQLIKNTHCTAWNTNLVLMTPE